ncbi:MAG: hypothetical protein LBH72_07765 [Proteiniphilum sp.]|nr:hypothetical protein [Proteiniphilum sp.]
MKKAAPASYNETLHTVLERDDVQALREYLASNPSNVNDASSVIYRQGAGKNQIVVKVPLLYDAVDRVIKGTCSAEMCQIIVDAGCDLNVPYEGITPVYLILDYLAAHSTGECETAEKLLSAFTSRADFDANYRFRSLLPPLAYLMRENHRHLGRFDKNYISNRVLRSLIEKGASVNTYDDEGNSLMVFALDTENEWLQQYFFDKGIDLAKQNREGTDVLYKVIEERNLPLVKRIISEGKMVLDEHSLKNDVSSLEKYPELYQYVVQLCADQAMKYTDIFDLQKFAEKFSKLNTLSDIFNRQKDLIYTEENISRLQEFAEKYPNVFNVGHIYERQASLIEAEENISTLQEFAKKYPNVFNAGHIYERQASLIEKEQKNILSLIRSKNYSANVNRSPVENFIARYTGNDPNNKISMVAYTLDLMHVVYGMKSAQEATKMIWTVYRNYAPDLLERWFNRSSWTICEVHSVEPYEKSVGTALAALDRIMAEDEAPVFAETKEMLIQMRDEFTKEHSEAVQIANRNNKRVAEEYARYKGVQNEYKAKQCANCEIDLDNKKNKLPESMHYDNIMSDILFGYSNPGVWYMKNGDKYEFYQTSDGKKWTVSTGWFSSEEFDTFKEMLEYFIKECENKYCR